MTLRSCVLAVLASVLLAGSASAQNAELVYTPIEPCRAVDTRFWSGGPNPFAADETRAIDVTGDLTAQGGNPAGCGVLQGFAKAVMVNFVAVVPSGPGNLRAWPWETDPFSFPNASVLNYSNLPGLNIANGIALPICGDPQTCTHDLYVRADVSGTHLVADIVGYFRTSTVKPQSFVRTSRTSTPSGPIGGVCLPLTSVGIDGQEIPNAPGKALVKANVVLRIDHVQGTDDHIRVCIDTTTLTCSSCGGSHLLPSALPSGTYEVTVPVMDILSATPGTMVDNAYWLLVKSESGSASADVVQSSYLEVVYLPD